MKDFRTFVNEATINRVNLEDIATDSAADALAKRNNRKLVGTTETGSMDIIHLYELTSGERMLLTKRYKLTLESGEEFYRYMTHKTASQGKSLFCKVNVKKGTIQMEEESKYDKVEFSDVQKVKRFTFVK